MQPSPSNDAVPSVPPASEPAASAAAKSCRRYSIFVATIDRVRKKPKPGCSFNDVYPEHAANWHPSLNGQWLPTDFTAGSAFWAKWNCVIHGVYDKQICAHRGHGCPDCIDRSPLTEERFIALAIECHGARYDYTDVKYVDATTKVNILCVIHGSFPQTPASHLSGSGCRQCGNKRCWDTKSFITQAEKVHGARYDYTASEYIAARTSITIACRIHGPFVQNPRDHLTGKGCRQCAVSTTAEKLSLGTTAFEQRAQRIHAGKYDYSQVHYLNTKTNVCIICPSHGPFDQLPANHLLGRGCDACGNERISAGMKSNTQAFVEKAAKVHADRYDYTRVIYTASQDRVIVLCREHGPFLVTPGNHLSGKGCKQCAFARISESRTHTTAEFVAAAVVVHGTTYDYSNVVYSSCRAQVTIKCKQHGDFPQTPTKHLSGHGCSKCRQSHMERNMLACVVAEQVTNRQLAQHSGPSWVLPLQPDFMLLVAEQKVIVEMDGRQHFQAVGFFGGQSGLEDQQRRDVLKESMCQVADIHLLRIDDTVSSKQYAAILRTFCDLVAARAPGQPALVQRTGLRYTAAASEANDDAADDLAAASDDEYDEYDEFDNDGGVGDEVKQPDPLQPVNANAEPPPESVATETTSVLDHSRSTDTIVAADEEPNAACGDACVIAAPASHVLS